MDYRVLPLRDLPRTQALSSKTFKPPPLDGSMTIAELYDWHLQNTPEHPLFVFADDSGRNHTILWPEVVRAVHGAGRRIRSMVSPGTDTSICPEVPCTVAILCAADTITYYTMMIGIVRAGHTAFPISPRNSPAAIAHLLKAADVKILIVGREKNFQTLAEASLSLVKENKPSTHLIPAFEDLYLPDSEKDFVPLSYRKPDLNEASIILHSSGSTAFPKAIPWNHYQILHIAVFPWFGGRDVTGYRLSCHAIPMFHGMGMMLTNWTCSSGLVLACFDPRTPSTPNPSTVLKGVVDTKARVAFSPPAFVEIWSRDPESVAILQGLDGVMFGGGPLDQGVGDALTAQGVTLCTSYGCTECGCFNKVFPTDVGKDWDYYEMSEVVEAEFLPDGNGNYELVVKPGPWMLPSVFNTTINGVPAYATGDLVTPHPTKPNFWKIFGRADDQIMHSTGEKTNPGPLENILNQDPFVQSAIMFGRGKFNAGVLIDPAPAYKFDPADVAALTYFRQKVWPSIEKMNQYAPQHSRIFKEMILVSKPSKPFTYTAKLTPRRQAILKDYAEEMEKLYESVDESTQPDFIPPTNWDLVHALHFVRTVVKAVLNVTPGDDDDIFQCGCDSLQATWIRNTLLNALRKSSNLDVRRIPINFIYENPSISALARFLSQVSPSSLLLTNKELVSRKVKDMEALVEKYSANFPSHVSANAPLAEIGIVVLLTGTTGGLGTALLVKLVESPSVSRVYALNRKSSTNILLRQKEAFAIRGLDDNILNSKKLVLLEGDFVDTRLGLDEDLYTEIQSTITHIIHNAYTVNFNLALPSFEPNIAGLRHLICLALSSPRASPPRLLFTSSIGVVRNCTVDGPVKEDYVDATSAVGAGYSESKWVCEQILAVAVKETPLKPIVVRIGQMTGSSTNGYWNPKEWVPTLFKSSVNIGYLPNVTGTISWLPVEVAAAAILEMCDAPNQVLHLAHPNPIAWSALVNPASEALHLQLVPYSRWLSKLESNESVDNAVGKEENSVLQLQEFFRSFSSTAMVDTENGAGEASVGEAMGLKQLDLQEAVKISPSLKNCAPLDFEEAKKWLSSWGLV